MAIAYGRSQPLVHLLTEEGERTGGKAWTAYPRPQMVRGNWQNLNGTWSFSTEEGGKEEDILVPFCPESLLSGICRTFEKEKKFYYRREFRLELPAEDRRILLHFGAVDQIATVSLNGTRLGTHVGGYLPFSFDVTDLLRETNELKVEAEDALDHSLPWGKQKKKRGGMWYTPVSGIWQTVWLESVPESYIQGLDIRCGRNYAEIRLKGVEQGTLILGDTDAVPAEKLPQYAFAKGKLRLQFKNPHVWSPEDPYLYRFTLRAGDDEVKSYFALRSLETKEINGKKRLCLNGEPYFFNGLLDQGYFSDGIYTPASPAMYEKDILAMKSLGYNTLRKHIKVEPERFYYDCDRLGMIVFQDMVNTGKYHFLRDTALPTAGIQKMRDRGWSDARSRSNFLSFMKAEVQQLSNHPCICLWTVFNEGWGQFDADAACDALRALDKSRFIDTTSGWFHRKNSDVDSLHIYFKPLKLGREDKPQLLSEFGGYVFKLPEHSADPGRTYGYRICRTREAFVKDLRSLYEDQLLPLVKKGLCGAVYTQVSDVEEETNGLFTYDRKLLKVQPEELADLMEKLKEAVKE